MPKLSMKVTRRDGAPVVACAGAIDETSRRVVEGVVTTLLEEQPRSLTIDCRSVGAVDVAGTEMLVRLAGRCYERGVSVDVIPSAATGDVAGLVWPFAIGARSFGRTPPGYVGSP